EPSEVAVARLRPRPVNEHDPRMWARGLWMEHSRAQLEISVAEARWPDSVWRRCRRAAPEIECAFVRLGGDGAREAPLKLASVEHAVEHAGRELVRKLKPDGGGVDVDFAQRILERVLAGHVHGAAPSGWSSLQRDRQGEAGSASACFPLPNTGGVDWLRRRGGSQGAGKQQRRSQSPYGCMAQHRAERSDHPVFSKSP